MKHNDKEIEEALERFSLSQESEADQRHEALDDLRFAALEQWPEALKRMREKDPNGARPCLVLDKIGQYRRQVINDTRQNLPSIRVRPVDDRSDKDTAEVLNGLIRHVEDVSSADMAYLTALDWAVTCGLGYFRILTEYLSDDAWDQEIRIARIHNPFAVYFDPHSTAPDGSDAEWCFITEDVPKKTFEKLYPKAEQGGDLGPSSEGDLARAWFSEDSIRVAEYFQIRREKDEVLLLADQSTLYGSRYQELLEEGADLLPVVRTRPVERRICHWQKITGREPLEEREFPSSYIPVIPVIGTEFWIEGKRQLSGLVRPAKDPQRCVNYYASVATEVEALTPRAPFIGAAGQFEGYEGKWGEANTENHAYLEYNPVALGGTLAPAPQRQPFPGAPSGMIQMMQIFEGHIQAALGMYQASVGAPSNEKSGIAIRERKNEGDVGTLHYRYNLSLSMRHAARILMEMIPRIYDTARVARIIGEDGTVDTVALDPAMGAASQQTPKGEPNLHNITIGRYDVSMDIGPAYATRRQDAAQGFTEMVRAYPPLMERAGDLMFRNMDWPGADQLADRLAPPEETEGGIPPQIQAQMQQMQQGYEQQLAQAQQMVEGLQQQLGEASQAAQEGQAAVKDKQGDHALKGRELEIKALEAETKRMELEIKAMEAQARIQAAGGSARAQDREADDPLKGKELELRAFELGTKRLEIEMRAHEIQSRVQQIQAETGQVQAQTQQTEGVNQGLAGLLQAQEGIRVAIGEFAQATQAMHASAQAIAAQSAAPKQIELVRDSQGRAAGAVVKTCP